MRIYNTLSRRLEEFRPLDGKRVRMYTCGPTVYDYAHIGNFRAYVFEDLLRRHLRYSGYGVTQAMNLTDVDDKTIRGAGKAGVPLAEYTQRYKDAFFSDIEALNIERAEFYPAATGHIPEMIDLIGRLFDRGLAYGSDDGSVYFNVAAFGDYGKLAHIDMSSLRGGARVAQDEYDKENVADFALWKAWDEADGDVAWDSPWGRGRPGWHIECSAMSMKYLGESFDLHTGGADNMFPHHENEIAQSEGATGKPFVKYWMHCGYLVVDGAKMSKSLGNFHTLRDLRRQGFAGRELRYVLLSAHYRQPLNFTIEAMKAARSALARLDEFRSRLAGKAGGAGAGCGGGAVRAPEWAEAGRRAFVAAMDDDLNMPEALAALFQIVHSGNKAMDAGELDGGGAAAALDVLRDTDRISGFLESGGDEPDGEIKLLLERRRAARESKNWAESDRIRDDLAARGWTVKDTPQGQKPRRN